MDNLRDHDRCGPGGEPGRLGKPARLDEKDLFEAVSQAALREVEGGAALLVDKVKAGGGTMGIYPVDPGKIIVDKVFSKGGMQQA